MSTLVFLMRKLVGNVVENWYEKAVIGKDGKILVISLKWAGSYQ